MFDKKKEKKPLDWGALGQFNNRVGTLFGLIRETYTKMGIGLELIEWLIDEKGGMTIFIEWLRSLGKKFQSAQQVEVPKLLKLVGSTTVPAIGEPFVAASKFLVTTADGAKPKILCISDNFKTWFLGKTEDPICRGSLIYYNLLEGSVDKPIITELGGEDKVEVKLAEVFYLMSRQPNGEDSVLLTNSYANIFYVSDHERVLRTVIVRWRSNGWFVNAHSVGSPNKWFSGNRVFSRNSVA